MVSFKTSLISRTVTIQGHRTTIRMEAAYWDALECMCREKGVSRKQVIEAVARGEGTLTSRLRMAVLNYHSGKLRPCQK